MANTATPQSMVERVSLILDAFDGPATALRMEALVQHTGLPRSTLHRIVDQLVRLGWLRRTRAGYVLGARSRRAGAGPDWPSILRTVAAPLLNELSLKTGLTSLLGILDQDEIVYIDVVGVRRDTSVFQVGHSVPAHASALGKAILAGLLPEDTDALLPEPLRRATAQTIRRLWVLHQELGRVRGRQGLAFDRDEAVAGLSSLAAPLRRSGDHVAAIAVTGPSEKDKTLEAAIPAVLATAGEIAAKLAAASDAIPSQHAGGEPGRLPLGRLGEDDWL